MGKDCYIAAWLTVQISVAELTADFWEFLTDMMSKPRGSSLSLLPPPTACMPLLAQFFPWLCVGKNIYTIDSIKIWAGISRVIFLHSHTGAMEKNVGNYRSVLPRVFECPEQAKLANYICNCFKQKLWPYYSCICGCIQPWLLLLFIGRQLDANALELYEYRIQVPSFLPPSLC